MQQAILVKYLPATNFKGSRLKAACERGSITIPYPHELSSDDRGYLAAEQLCEKFAKEDEKNYGTPIQKNPWMRRKIGGALPNNKGYAFVFVETTK